MRIAPHDAPFFLAKIDAFHLNYGILKEVAKRASWEDFAYGSHAYVSEGLLIYSHEPIKAAGSLVSPPFLVSFNRILVRQHVCVQCSLPLCHSLKNRFSHKIPTLCVALTK